MNSTNDIVTAGVTIYGMPIPVFCALLSASISAGIAFSVAALTRRTGQRQYIESLITKIIEIGITYPYLEDDDFCANWTKANRRDEGMRYDNYCCLVFNLLEQLWRYSRQNPKMIEDIFGAREMIVRHRVWWGSEVHNHTGYRDVRFHEYINAVINQE